MTYRPDIDGLRAIAVLAVVVFHAFPSALPSGFAGVDVFFVISGYLITQDIRQRMAAGAFSLADFYLRRVRRIFPALIVVLTAVWAVGSLFLFTDEFQQLVRHIVASALFAQNFQLITEAGYFDSASATKPLLHLWSLAIEEQFYLLWPLAMLWRPTLIARTVIVGSLLALMFWPDPTQAYYLPITRAWEMMIGAALALKPIQLRLGWVGIGLCVLACTGAPFVPSAILATLGSAIVISSGVPALGVLSPIGRISYPLYLWHWPALAFLRILDPNPSVVSVLVAVALSFLLAWLTSVFIEKPIRSAHARHIKVKAAALALALVGGLGATTAMAGDPRAWASSMAAKMADLRFPRPQGQSCGWEGIQCIQGRARAIVIGDSQAEQIAPPLLKAGWWMATTPGCPPFPQGRCDGSLIELVAALDVETVVLSFREGYALDGLEASLKKLRGKKVIILTSVPSLDFEPRDCLARPWFAPRVADCSIGLTTVLERQASPRQIINDAAAKYGAEVVDTSALLCDADRCRVDQGGMLIYRDKHHLSARGGQTIASFLLMASRGQ